MIRFYLSCLFSGCLFSGCLFSGCLLSLLLAGSADARTWTDRSGTFRMEAEFVEFKDGAVVLRRTNGKVVRLPLDELSPDDREFVSQAQAQAGDGKNPTEGQAEAKSKETLTPEEKAAAELLKKYVAIEGVARRPEAVLAELARRASQEDAKKKKDDTENKKDEVSDLKEGVVRGDWKQIGKHLSSLPPKYASGIYSHMLNLLSRGGYVRPDEILDLAAAAPAPLEPKQIKTLGKLLRVSLRQVDRPGHLLQQIEAGSSGLGGDDPQHRLAAARLLISAGLLDEAGKYLPSLNEALETDDLDVLMLHVQHYRAKAKSKDDPREARANTHAAWWLSRTVGLSKQRDAEARQEAFKALLDLVDEVPRWISTEWLEHLFRSDRADSLELLSIVTRRVDSAYRQGGNERRVQQLEILKRVCDELLPVAQQEPAEWKLAMRMLTLGWINEAQKCLGGANRKLVYPDDHEISKLSAEEILPLALSEEVYDFLQPDTARHMRRLTAMVAARAADKYLTFKIIEKIKQYDEEVARDVAEEFVSHWTESLLTEAFANNEMAQRYLKRGYTLQQVRRMLGGRSRGGGISLTRAMQSRYLEKLSTLRTFIKKRNLLPLSDKVWLDSFVRCHSPAEIFSEKEIVATFGPLNQLSPKLAAGLTAAMRPQLAGPWQNTSLQNQLGTQRTEDELIAEVRQGYQMAIAMIESAIKNQEAANSEANSEASSEDASEGNSETSSKSDLVADHKSGHETEIQLYLELAKMVFDSAEFEYGQLAELEKYIQLRDYSFAAFAKAAELYNEALESRKLSEYSIDVYLQWFQAALGASDLAYLTLKDEPNLNQLQLIRQAIDTLKVPRRRVLLSLFADAINLAMRSVPSHMKPWFVENALVVLKKHKSGQNLTQLDEYYKELLTELELTMSVDGSTDVGYARPFGVQLALRHTTAIGRESSGFNWLLAKTNSSRTGSAIVDSREKLEKQLREKLSEDFEVHEVKFHQQNVKPRGFGREDWRETPLCYVVLSAKDAAVDTIPSIQLDLDFNDGNGQVMLPVHSGKKLIDATSEPERRPVDNLSVRQTLDERELGDGTLKLEVHAQGDGVLGDLNEVLQVDMTPGSSSIPGFRVVGVEDNGLVVSELNTNSEQVIPRCERNWLVQLRRDDSRTSGQFSFPAPRGDGVAMEYERYADADIEPASAELVLAVPRIANSSTIRVAKIVCAIVVLVGLIVISVIVLKGRTIAGSVETPYHRPNSLSAFTLVTLLKRMRDDERVKLTPADRSALNSTIGDLENRFFGRDIPATNGQSSSVTGELERVLDRWLPIAAISNGREH